MKFKRHLKYRLFKLIFKNYTKFLQILYKHKLNSNLIKLIKKEVEIKTVYDIGAHRGDFSNFLSKTSLKGKDFYLFEANEKNEKYLNKFDFKYFIDVLSDIPDHEEMYLMSQCKYNIIANSSFSWWGAWLNQNSDKKVIAPKKWVKSSTLNTNDLIPASWIRL